MPASPHRQTVLTSFQEVEDYLAALRILKSEQGHRLGKAGLQDSGAERF
ncbi:MAG: hypothetical protein WAW36_00480 [Methylovulum miyakonense]